MKYEGYDFPDGISELQDLVKTNYRNYWDRMYLENKGGRTELDIRHLFIRMNFDKAPPNCYKEIPIVDYDVNKKLRSGNALLDLNPYARISRYNFAALEFTEHPVALAAVRDLGKSGSDGKDNYGNNPKYRGELSLLCSEFASWYYHEEGLVVGNNNFRDITATQQMHDIFKSAKRLYRYHSGHKKFIHHKTERTYHPRAGDYLERRGTDGEAEHSMIILRWDNANKIATVINGPWPVTIRSVYIQTDEEGGKDYHLGRI